jgi:hypothetical protein
MAGSESDGLGRAGDGDLDGEMDSPVHVGEIGCQASPVLVHRTELC